MEWQRSENEVHAVDEATQLLHGQILAPGPVKLSSARDMESKLTRIHRIYGKAAEVPEP